MRILITGGTGFIGGHLVNALSHRGDECLVVSRSGKDLWNTTGVRVVEADPAHPGQWQEEVSAVDAVINLAGERIVDPPKRWTSTRKRSLIESRVSTTENIANAIRGSARPPARFLSGSAIGYYGPRGDDILGEDSTPGNDFLARLSRDWEAAANRAADVVPVTLLRTGIVLGTDGGALPSLLPSFKLGAGGPWGTGRQWWSWIHIADEIGLILMLLDNDLDGAFNLTAPNPVTVNEFAKKLGKALRRPALVRAPGFMLRAALGESADALLELQRAVPNRAIEHGYQFQYPKLSDALSGLF